MRASRYTTLLLVIIVLILLFGVGIAIYYVLDLDWFEKNPVDIQDDVNVYKELPNVQIKTEKEIKYDINKRTYNLLLETEDVSVIVYKDGTVGVILEDNEQNKEIEIYKEILNKEVKLNMTNIIRAYDIMVSKSDIPNRYILLLDVDGHLYSLDKQQLAKTGKYEFIKIDGLSKIVDVRQITNDDLTENTLGMNAIAIDEESNELLLTNYLLK